MVDILECPSRFDTVAIFVPCAIRSEALECLNPWKVTLGKSVLAIHLVNQWPIVLGDFGSPFHCMQLTDYPHLENVCSNVLAFFFNTEEAHGFGSLFIKSLLECVSPDIHCQSTEVIEREMPTQRGKRIDIFIETDRQLIAIENKVYSGVDNPFDDYEAHIHKLNLQSEKELVFVLLTLREEKADGTAFVNVTYPRLFGAIRKNIGAYIVDASSKWIIILNDFIRTIEQLMEGAALDKDFINFYNEHEDTIIALVEAQKRLPKSLKAKLKSIASLVLPKRPASNQDLYASQSEYYAEYYLTYTDIDQIGAPLDVTLYIDTKECALLIGIDEGNVSQMKRLEKLLADNKLKYSRWEENNDFYLVGRFGIFEADAVIAKEFQRLLDIV